MNSFDSWKFWLSSAALFAGILVVGLIPGCAKGAELQPQRSQGCALRADQSLSETAASVGDPAP